MEAIPGDAYNSFVRWVDYTYGTPQCFDPSFEGMVQRASNIEWDTEGTTTGSKLNLMLMYILHFIKRFMSLGRQWYYSQCTQIGSFLIADEFSWLPGRISVLYHMEKCQRVFGEKLE